MDKRAKTILLKTYWSGTGWNDQPVTSPEDFSYAKAKGLMFEPASFSHDEGLDTILALCQRIPPAKAARAFLCSLSTRRPDWRSGLASYAIARQLVPHPYTPVVTGHSYGPGGVVTSTSHSCGACRGVSGAKSHYRDVDLNVLNFERVKWGGVRHGKLEYTWFDLQQLEQAEIPEPSPADLAVFQAILAVIAASAPGDYPGALEQNLAPALPSSKNERRSLIEILACARILEPGSHDRPGRGKTDWNHAADWRGVDRYNADSVCSHFGAWMPPIETSV